MEPASEFAKLQIQRYMFCGRAEGLELFTACHTPSSTAQRESSEVVHTMWETHGGWGAVEFGSDWFGLVRPIEALPRAEVEPQAASHRMTVNVNPASRTFGGSCGKCFTLYPSPPNTPRRDSSRTPETPLTPRTAAFHPDASRARARGGRWSRPQQAS